MIPGNNLRDNWFMGAQPVEINTISDLLNKIIGFNENFKLRDKKGKSLTLKMGDEAGVLVIDT